MSFVTMQEINRVQLGFVKSAKQIIVESTIPSPDKKYDIFLSHSYRDHEFILKVKTYIEEYGHSVYIDWIDDRELDRSKVTKDTADILKSRMVYCKCLFYVYTPNASESKWMPWELGYFDGLKGKVAIFPIINANDSFLGQEYLGLYPYIDEASANSDGKDYLWLNHSESNYKKLLDWI